MAPEISIVCAADERFAMPLAVMLRSAAATCSRPVRAFVLSNELSDRAKREIEAACNRHPRPPAIEWLDAETDYLRDAPKGLSHLSRATYLRFAIGRLISQSVRRIIYLDCDLLVVRDITPLWDMPMEDNTIRAVRDFWTPAVGQPNALAYCISEIGIDPSHPMFNAGVLLIDLDAYRQEHVEDRCVEFIGRWAKHIRSADQDALNGVLWNRWKPLDFQWNVQTGAWEDFKSSALLDATQKAALRDVDPAILHFSGANKPWNSGLRSPRCEQYVRSVGDSGWFGKTGFQMWKARRAAVCIRSAALNRFASFQARRRQASGSQV
jgi:lipopolysaccharide biosynthesis glycosyltransferase